MKSTKKKAYYIRYTPREYCGTGNASGALGQEYSILFLLRRTYDRIPEYYVRSGGNYHFHCIHHDSRGNYQI